MFLWSARSNVGLSHYWNKTNILAVIDNYNVVRCTDFRKKLIKKSRALGSLVKAMPRISVLPCYCARPSRKL